MDFYANFEAICKLRKTTPGHVCVAIGKGRGTAHNWKVNKTIPRAEMLEALAAQLHCDISAFFASTPALAKVMADQGDMNEQEKDLLRIYQACPDGRTRHEFMSLAYLFEDEHEL